MKFKKNHRYLASLHAPGMLNAVISAALEGVGFVDVVAYNEDEAFDPQGPPGNRDFLADEFDAGLKDDPVADHWVDAVFQGDPAQDFPGTAAGVHIQTIRDAGDVGGPSKGTGGGGGTGGGTGGTSKGSGGGGGTGTSKGGGTGTGGKGTTPAKPPGGTIAPMNRGRAVAIAALATSVVLIGVGAVWWHQYNSKKRRRRKKKPEELAA